MIDGVTNEIILLVMPSIIFNLCPDDRPSPPPPPPFLLLSCAFFLAINNHHVPPISTQFNLPQQIRPPQHSVYQHSCSDFIEDSPR